MIISDHILFLYLFHVQSILHFFFHFFYMLLFLLFVQSILTMPTNTFFYRTNNDINHHVSRDISWQFGKDYEGWIMTLNEVVTSRSGG